MNAIEYLDRVMCWLIDWQDDVERGSVEWFAVDSAHRWVEFDIIGGILEEIENEKEND